MFKKLCCPVDYYFPGKVWIEAGDILPEKNVYYSARYIYQGLNNIHYCTYIALPEINLQIRHAFRNS